MLPDENSLTYFQTNWIGDIMGVILLSVAGFAMVWAIFEFFAMIMSYDDYGDNGHISLIITIILAMFVGGLVLLNNESDDIEVTAQDGQLSDQWSEEAIEDMIMGVKEDIAEKLAPRNDVVEERLEDLEESTIDETSEPQLVPEVQSYQQVVPANKAHIDINRRNYDLTVDYHPETREACIDSDQCYVAKLIQHTDGSFWACKRNYGTCYEYQ